MFTMRHLGDAVLNAKRRGVDVRIISDNSMINSSGTQINRLQGEGTIRTKSMNFFLSST